MPTYKLLQLSGGYYAKVSPEDYDRVNQYKWSFNRSKWCKGYGRRIRLRKSIMLHRFIMNAPDGVGVDHINANGLDNRRENLRFCTQSQNMMWKRIAKRNTSGYKGVAWNKRMNKWCANIGLNGTTKYLGSFSDPAEAARAYDRVAKLHYGDFARLNFPDGS